MTNVKYLLSANDLKLRINLPMDDFELTNTTTVFNEYSATFNLIDILDKEDENLNFAILYFKDRLNGIRCDFNYVQSTDGNTTGINIYLNKAYYVELNESILLIDKDTPAMLTLLDEDSVESPESRGYLLVGNHQEFEIDVHNIKSAASIAGKQHRILYTPVLLTDILVKESKTLEEAKRYFKDRLSIVYCDIGINILPFDGVNAMTVPTLVDFYYQQDDQPSLSKEKIEGFQIVRKNMFGHIKRGELFTKPDRFTPQCNQVDETTNDPNKPTLNSTKPPEYTTFSARVERAITGLTAAQLTPGLDSEEDANRQLNELQEAADELNQELEKLADTKETDKLLVEIDVLEQRWKEILPIHESTISNKPDYADARIKLSDQLNWSSKDNGETTVKVKDQTIGYESPIPFPSGEVIDLLPKDLCGRYRVADVVCLQTLHISVVDHDEQESVEHVYLSFDDHIRFVPSCTDPNISNLFAELVHYPINHSTLPKDKETDEPIHYVLNIKISGCVNHTEGTIYLNFQDVELFGGSFLFEATKIYGYTFNARLKQLDA